MLDQIADWIRWILDPSGGSTQDHIDHYFKVLMLEITKVILKRKFLNEAKIVPKTQGVRNPCSSDGGALAVALNTLYRIILTHLRS